MHPSCTLCGWVSVFVLSSCEKKGGKWGPAVSGVHPDVWKRGAERCPALQRGHVGQSRTLTATWRAQSSSKSPTGNQWVGSWRLALRSLLAF